MNKRKSRKNLGEFMNSQLQSDEIVFTVRRKADDYYTYDIKYSTNNASSFGGGKRKNLSKILKKNLKLLKIIE